jgi:FdhD protein
MEAIERVNIRKYDRGGMVETADELAIEEPLGIYLRSGPAGGRSARCISVTMRTPGNDAELGAGFLFTEAIIRNKAQVASVKTGGAGENTVEVALEEGVSPALQNADRNFYTTSSCGVCGKASVEAIRTVSPFDLPPDEMRVPATTLNRLPGLLRAQQAVFRSTGGLHASALFRPDGELIGLREDVGRHNALDKLIGAAFLDGALPLNNEILLLSGRASFELVQKASMAGIRIIAAVGAPSSLAVQLAAGQDITLIGFLRDARFNIYTHGRRIDV